MQDLLWFLLPVGFLAGWLAAVKSGRGNRRSGGERPYDKAYFQGLNFLISDQPDRALEVFTQMVEVNTDTVEVHLALGSLFRRRGEVDRAIRVHQNLIARPSLDREHRAMALLALGEDYMSAGLLDRAESLFQQVLEFDGDAQLALQRLVSLYQQEQEWDSAIDAATQLESRFGENRRHEIAQFHCELAQQALDRGDVTAARSRLKRALGADDGCARAAIMAGQLELKLGHYRTALKHFHRVRDHDPDFLPQVLPGMQQCYTQLGMSEQYRLMLDNIKDVSDPGSVVLACAEVLRQEKGVDEAVAFLHQKLQRVPSARALVRMLDWRAEEGQTLSPPLDVMRHTLQRLVEERATYECRRCGFTARNLFWQCPSCKSWSSVRPVRGGLNP